MKKRLMAVFLTVISVFCCFFTACGKSDEEMIEDRIEEFVEAYNDGDTEALLECMDRKSRNQLQATMNVLGSLSGALLGVDISLSDLFTLGIAMTEEDWLTVEIFTITVDGDAAIANGTMTLNNGYFVENDNVTFFMLKEDGDWYVQDMKDYYVAPPADDSSSDSTSNGGNAGGNADDNTGGGTSDGTEAQASYEVEYYIGRFVDGYAWVKYKNTADSSSYSGFIDTQGNVLYSYAASEAPKDHYNIGKGSAFVSTDTGFKLMNSSGDVLETLEGEVEIKAYGGGYAFVYQNKSTITTVEYLYGIIDHTGEWKMPLTNLYDDDVFNNVEHLENEMFCLSWEWNDYYVNAEQATLIKFIDAWLTVDETTGMMYFEAREEEAYIEIYSLSDQSLSERIEFSGYYLLHPDGTGCSVGQGELKNGKLITEVDGYLQITDYTKATPTTVTFDKYPASMIEEVEFFGDYGLLQIYGVDEVMYVTMIDTQGNELCEPIKNKHLGMVKYAGDGYLYFAQDDVTYRVDKNGNKTEMSVAYSRYNFYDFYGGIGIVSSTWTESGYCVSANGEKLFESLTVK